MGEEKKLDCKLIGEDGNIFNLMAHAAKTMRTSDYWKDKVNEMYKRVQDSGNYYIALTVIGEYVNII